MASNLDRYRKDLESLIADGERLILGMQLECFPEQVRKQLRKTFGEDTDKIVKGLPSIKKTYQGWYSEAKTLVKQLLPDRLSDFSGHYETQKSRKQITYENYRIHDYMQ